MPRKLFCQLHPITYKISQYKGIFLRKLLWLSKSKLYANNYNTEKLPQIVYKHKSLIRRKLGNVDMQLQENKAVNLALATPSITGIVIKPNQIFSFWKLVGNCTAKKGYKEGLIIKGNNISKGIAGGMCQFTNLIHWMILHSPLQIIEHHHHNQLDMFPDYGRQIPFGTGTSIMYNYKDYQFINNTDKSFQLITYTTDKHLCGELRSDQELNLSYHVVEKEHYFMKLKNKYYRHNKIFKKAINKTTGNIVSEEFILENNSLVMYDSKFIAKDKIKIIE
ncbi:VanW family protein [Clostridium sp. 'deep sea']|uniref:VanW family protein n=1 Tax=Clostridium sp. 'deep sea' TaxID=2779445 RepID=UPI0018968B44|nr:VanW family protein [Clostridium sp. 'deep sea']QOR34786.1 VanW family protein [Clostridium sp. 'deep sea']